MIARVAGDVSLIASIHDVTPAHAEAVQSLWRHCRAEGITPALFVVPNWHGKWPLDAHEGFVGWIRACAAEGADILLHGERHDEVGTSRRLVDHARAIGRTNREGEFLTLDRWQARERIERGLRLLRSFGLTPIGFVPPAWLARATTHDVVRDVGLRVSEDVGGVYVHGSAASWHLASPAVRWSGRTTMRAQLSRAAVAWQWYRGTRRRASGDAVVRLALHPQDLAHPVTSKSVLGAVSRFGQRTAPLHYRGLVD